MRSSSIRSSLVCRYMAHTVYHMLISIFSARHRLYSSRHFAIAVSYRDILSLIIYRKKPLISWTV